jgi:hypothetical protein
VGLTYFLKKDAPDLASERGMGILEVVIASGLMTAVLLAIGTMMNSNYKSARNVASFADFNSLITEISMTLRNRTLCATAFRSGGTNILFQPILPSPPLSSTVAISVDVPRFEINNSLLLQINQIVGPYSVTQMRFDKVYDYYVSGASTYAVNFHLELTKRDASDMGAAVRASDFPVVVKTNPANGRIYDCPSTIDPGASQVTVAGVETSILKSNSAPHSGSRSVTFPTPFLGGVPVVTIAPRWNRFTGNEDTGFWVTDVTQTGFTIRWHGPDADGTVGASDDDGVSWIAVGPM